MPPLNRNNNIIGKLGLIILGFITLTSSKNNPKREAKKASATHKTTITIPYLQKDFVGFKEALAFKESQGKYRTVNKLGYLGKYQFGKSTLHRFKIYNTQKFLQTPKLQEKAFVALCKVNKWILRREIKRFNGKYINRIKITESGILAAAHLAGAGNVKKYLRSYGKYKFNDAFGTSIEEYLKKFKDYNVSIIVANKNATV